MREEKKTETTLGNNDELSHILCPDWSNCGHMIHDYQDTELHLKLYKKTNKKPIVELKVL